MKRVLFIGMLGMFFLGSCNNQSKQEQHDHSHEGHSHTTEAHNHENCNHDHGAEGHKHDAHDHEGHNHDHEGHNHDDEGHNHDHEGCNHDHEGHDHAHGENSDEIVIPKAKADAAGIQSNTIEAGKFHQIIKTGGQVLSAQGDESVAVATVSGVVSFRSRAVEGMNVAKGTALVTISSRNMADGDPIERAKITYEIAKKEYERMQALAENKIVSERELLQAKQDYENARLSYESVGKNSSANGQIITSPIAGYIKNILVKEGDYVERGQPLMSITQNRRLFLRAEVSEKYYPQLRSIGSANFKTPYDNKVYKIDDLGGRLLSYGKSAGDNSYYVPVTFEFDNKGDIIPGAFVEVYLLSIPMNNIISLPHTALTEEQGSYFVYLQLDGECYKKQEVTLGANNGESVQILTGINSGDRVVTHGAYQVKLASASNALPAHTHEH